jgi:transcriptional regulator with XRE-family HTH domain
MAMQVLQFTTEGHRLLVESFYRPAEVARLAGVARQRVSEWRAGQKRPVAEARSALERAIGIPSRAWVSPPLRREPRRPADVPAAVRALLSGALLSEIGLADFAGVIVDALSPHPVALLAVAEALASAAAATARSAASAAVRGATEATKLDVEPAAPATVGEVTPW